MFKCEEIGSGLFSAAEIKASDDPDEFGDKDCQATCPVNDGTLGGTCGKLCTKVAIHKGQHYCSTHGAF